MFDLELFVLSETLSSAVNVTNTIFCSHNGSKEVVNQDPTFVKRLAEQIAEKSSRMSLDGTISILEKALKLVDKREVAKTLEKGRQAQGK